MSASRKEIVKQIDAAFSASNLEGFLAHCTDDIVWDMVGDRTVRGKEAIRQWMSSMPSEPPDFTVRETIGEGDTIMARGDMTMKEKDGAVVPYAYCDIYQFRGDKVADLRSFVMKTATQQAAVG